MPVRHALLALLAEEPAHGYQLKAAFEARTGGSWTLNIGQVYSTLQRLERDGLVVADEPDEDRIVHRATDAGRRALATWYATPIVPVPPPRDELAIKVLIAIAAPDVDEAAVVQRQRTALLEHLQALTRRKIELDPVRDLAEILHLDALLLRSEAEVRWLDVCEARLRQVPPESRTAAGLLGSTGGDLDTTDPTSHDDPSDRPPAGRATAVPTEGARHGRA